MTSKVNGHSFDIPKPFDHAQEDKLAKLFPVDTDPYAIFREELPDELPDEDFIPNQMHEIDWDDNSEYVRAIEAMEAKPLKWEWINAPATLAIIFMAFIILSLVIALVSKG
jgi:hypothetical protein